MSITSQDKELKKSGANIKIYHGFTVATKNKPTIIDGVETVAPDTLHSFAVKKPNASERDSAQEIRSQFTTYYMEKGLLPEAVLRKKLADMGGTVSKNEDQNYLNLNLALLTLESEYQLLKSEQKALESEGKIDDAKTKGNEADAKFALWGETKRKIVSMETDQNMTYENSAEAKARDKMIQFVSYMLYSRGPANPDDINALPKEMGLEVL